MGIFYNDEIYGISCRLLINDEFVTIFEEKYDNKMNTTEILKMKIIYDKLSYENNRKYNFRYYTEISDSYSFGLDDYKPTKKQSMGWYLIDKKDIEIWINNAVTLNVYPPDDES
jgi:hypothetical protein